MVTRKQGEDDKATPLAGPVKVEVVKVDLAKDENRPTAVFWIGVISECPYGVVHLNAMDFPRETEEVRQDEDSGTTQRIPRKGKIVTLELSRIERIKEAVLSKVIRKVGARPLLLTKKAAHYRPSSNDIPLAKFVYMIPIKEVMPPNFRESDPETMA